MLAQMACRPHVSFGHSGDQGCHWRGYRERVGSGFRIEGAVFMSGPLASLKVLDFSTLLPGPFATLMLADMGEIGRAHV